MLQFYKYLLGLITEELRPEHNSMVLDPFHSSLLWNLINCVHYTEKETPGIDKSVPKGIE